MDAVHDSYSMLIARNEARKILRALSANEKTINVTGILLSLHKGKYTQTIQLDELRASLDNASP